MRVFHVTKRAYYPLTTWEPIFICSHEAPQYDERLTWEGRKDKMTHVSIKTSPEAHVNTAQSLQSRILDLTSSRLDETF